MGAHPVKSISVIFDLNHVFTCFKVLNDLSFVNGRAIEINKAAFMFGKEANSQIFQFLAITHFTIPNSGSVSISKLQ